MRGEPYRPTAHEKTLAWERARLNSIPPTGRASRNARAVTRARIETDPTSILDDDVEERVERGAQSAFGAGHHVFNIMFPLAQNLRRRHPDDFHVNAAPGDTMWIHDVFGESCWLYTKDGWVPGP